MRERITVKGGVLMCALSGSKRRATQDIDLDFVRYPLSDKAIKEFIERISVVGNYRLRVVGEIEELGHQEYEGRRVRLEVDDGRTRLSTKLDLGVHASVDMEQDPCWFDVGRDGDSVCLLANSMEQIFTEKLRSLLLHGIRSTRYRDLYDLYWIGHRPDLDRRRLVAYVNSHIIGDGNMWDNDYAGISARVARTLTSRQFLSRMRASRKGWIDMRPDEIARWLPAFILELDAIADG